jgi:hypothetical protein
MTHGEGVLVLIGHNMGELKSGCEQRTRFSSQASPCERASQINKVDRFMIIALSD